MSPLTPPLRPCNAPEVAQVIRRANHSDPKESDHHGDQRSVIGFMLAPDGLYVHVRDQRVQAGSTKLQITRVILEKAKEAAWRATISPPPRANPKNKKLSIYNAVILLVPLMGATIVLGVLSGVRLNQARDLTARRSRSRIALGDADHKSGVQARADNCADMGEIYNEHAPPPMNAGRRSMQSAQIRSPSRTWSPPTPRKMSSNSTRRATERQ